MNMDTDLPAGTELLAGEAETVWRPAPEWLERARLTDYLRYLDSTRGLRFASYHDLWAWSVTDLASFWTSIWEYFDVIASASAARALGTKQMPGADWFPGTRLNWTENLLRRRNGEGVAIIAVDEGGSQYELSWSQLRSQVAAAASRLRAWGIRPGDRVAAYLPNVPEAVIALLATASVGAIWSCCAPDFSGAAAADRLAPLAPRVLFTVDGYSYGGREISRQAESAALLGRLPTVEYVVTISRLGLGSSTGTPFASLVTGSAAERYEQVPFGHPLWVLFSSGTTGAPKGLVHSHGGILLESLKANALHYDLNPGDRVFIAASTAWVVWNMLVDAMCTGATIVTYDGSPSYPDPGRLLRIASEQRVTRFGTGAAYLAACHRAGLRPRDELDFGCLRTIMSTGSPLPPAAWHWVYDTIKEDVLLGSDSGGTDVATGFIGSNPLLPARVGQCQSAGLGVLAQSWNGQGKPVTDEVGELVIAAPMPSMPVSFYGDTDGSQYRDAYFSVYPGVWRHGDWVTETSDHSFVVHGRSDATINRGGVRMGSADIYAVLAELPDVADSMVIGAELPSGGYYMPMFVQLAEGATLDEKLQVRIRSRIREGLSPRHVPDEIIAVPGIPLTRTGKKLELAVKRLLQGTADLGGLPLGGMQDPGVMQWYADFATEFRARRDRS